jgi:metal-sulfur cluster biosynthetic enzyme
MSEAWPYPFTGAAAMAPRIAAALGRVIDPEMALDIVELGLVYGVEADGTGVRVRITMTSAACPVTELIVDEVGRELRRELGVDTEVSVEVVWDPPWGPERLGERARAVLDWD